MEEQDPEKKVRDWGATPKKPTAFCGRSTNLLCETESGGSLMMLCQKCWMSLTKST